MNEILYGDARQVLPSLTERGVRVQTCVTSPPYFGLRDYGTPGELGQESSPEEYTENLVTVFREVRRLLSDDGTLWVNLGDSYNAAGRKGHGTRVGFKQGSNRASRAGADHPRPTAPDLKPKDLIGVPWMVAFALRADGWYLRQDIVWAKPNPMPEPVRDRCTKSHEYVFLFSKQERYFFDMDSIAEEVDSGTRHRRDVWTITPRPYDGAHFAVFPPELVRTCVLAGTRPNDVVLDPFLGSGTTAMVSRQLGRRYLGIEINSTFEDMQRARIAQENPREPARFRQLGLLD